MGWAEFKKLSEAEIKVVSSSDYAGVEVILKRDGEEYKRAVLDDDGSALFVVEPMATFTVVDTNGSGTDDFPISSGEYAIIDFITIPTGSTATPLNDVTVWLACAGLKSAYPYTSIDEILTDSACVLALMTSDNACDYLVRCSKEDEGGMVNGILGNQEAMTQMGANHYCALLMAKNKDWSTWINNTSYWNKVWVDYSMTTTDTVAPNGTWAFTGWGNCKLTDYNTSTAADFSVQSTSLAGYHTFTFDRPFIAKRMQYHTHGWFDYNYQQAWHTMTTYMQHLPIGGSWETLESSTSTGSASHDHAFNDNITTATAVRAYCSGVLAYSFSTSSWHSYSAASYTGGMYYERWWGVCEE